MIGNVLQYDDFDGLLLSIGQSLAPDGSPCIVFIYIALSLGS